MHRACGTQASCLRPRKESGRASLLPSQPHLVEEPEAVSLKSFKSLTQFPLSSSNHETTGLSESAVRHHLTDSDNAWKIGRGASVSAFPNRQARHTWSVAIIVALLSVALLAGSR